MTAWNTRPQPQTVGDMVPLGLFNEAIEVLQTIKLNAGYGKAARDYAGYRLEGLTIKRAQALQSPPATDGDRRAALEDMPEPGDYHGQFAAWALQHYKTIRACLKGEK